MIVAIILLCLINIIVPAAIDILFLPVIILPAALLPRELGKLSAGRELIVAAGFKLIVSPVMRVILMATP